MVTALFILLPVASASSVGAKDVQVTSEYVKATALCSCGLNGYHYITASFLNYCPRCHSYGTLSFNPKGTPEGEWTCIKCDSDYCAADGKEKISGSHYYLQPYTDDSSSKSGEPVAHAQEVTNGTAKNQILSQIAIYSDRSFLSI